jgi:ABC-type transport system substrate-binding protein
MMAGMAAVRVAVVCAAVALTLTGCTSGAAEPLVTSALVTTAPTATATTTTTTTTTTSSPAKTTTTLTPTAVPPFIARVQWVRGSGGRSLHIVPTASGRVAQGAAADDEAWAEVLRLAPDADQPGMRAQFDCHWTYARLVQPDKPSWNIEPWRPVVTAAEMVDARCNPGGPESAEG